MENKHPSIEYKINHIKKEYERLNKENPDHHYELKQYHLDVINEDKLWSGNWRGTGATKTCTTLLTAEGNVVVITPKTLENQQSWLKEQKKFNIDWLKIKQFSCELFKSDKWKAIPNIGIDTLIIDEAHVFFGVSKAMKKVEKQWVKDYSKSFINLYKYIKLVKPKRLYLLTASPAGNKEPIKLYAAKALLGVEYSFQDFLEKFYNKVPNYRKIPVNGKWVVKAVGNKVVKKSDPKTEELLSNMWRGCGYTGSIFDFNEVPEQFYVPKFFQFNTKQKEELKRTKEIISDPNLWGGITRSIENGRVLRFVREIVGKEEEVKLSFDNIHTDKDDYILQLAEEFPKLIIFANYRKQCDYISKYLREAGYTVFELNGSTKDRTPFQEKGLANTTEKCICVIQASVSAGYDLNSFRTVVYASMNNALLHYTQSKGRALRTNNLQTTLYLYLITQGGEDERCYDSIMSCNDFDEKMNKYNYD